MTKDTTFPENINQADGKASADVGVHAPLWSGTPITSLLYGTLEDFDLRCLVRNLLPAKEEEHLLAFIRQMTFNAERLQNTTNRDQLNIEATEILVAFEKEI